MQVLPPHSYLLFWSSHVQTDPAWRQGVPRVDVGLVKDYAGRLPEGKKITMAGGGHVPLQELARFRCGLVLVRLF